MTRGHEHGGVWLQKLDRSVIVIAVCCSVLQCVAVCCSVLQCVLQCVAVCVVVCCSVL